jgi:coenzyme F420 hydrogenase subunit beta
MKTFSDLIQEVLDPGLCHRCGACVAFCSAINYGALAFDSEGLPVYADKNNCIEGGLCYEICPAIDKLETETKNKVAWTAPMGRVADILIARAKDPAIRRSATDGGVVTALLVYLFQKGQIDGAVVTKSVGPFQRESFLAVTEDHIRSAAGFFFDTASGMQSVGDYYSTIARLAEFNPMLRQGLRRVAFVGTPCQIKAMRKMQTLNIYPSDSVKICFGLFCSGNFIFGEKERQEIAQIAGFQWDHVKKINIKEDLIVHMASGEALAVRLSDLEFLKRHACQFCFDFSAEYADISFGGLGAEEGWTTVIVRSPVGTKILADSKNKAIEANRQKDIARLSNQALKKVRRWSDKKKDAALENRKILGIASSDNRLEVRPLKRGNMA